MSTSSPPPPEPTGSPGPEPASGAPPAVFDTGLAPGEIRADRPRPVETPWGTMALYRLGDELLCCQAFCPHLEGPLFQGTLSGTTVTCPWHLWRFDLVSGARVDAARPRGGPGTEPLSCCAVELSPQGTVRLRRPRRRA